MTEKEKCYLPIDWDAVWKERQKRVGEAEWEVDRAAHYVRELETVLEEHINKAITIIVNNNTNISIDTKLEVIKELYMKRSEESSTLSTSFYADAIIKLIGAEESKALAIVREWKDEFLATKEV